MKDIENFVGFCLPMMIQRLNLHSKGLSEDEAIQKVSTWLYTGCVFENHWRDEGADDVRNYCREKGYTALLKQLIDCEIAIRMDNNETHVPNFNPLPKYPRSSLELFFLSLASLCKRALRCHI